MSMTESGAAAHSFARSCIRSGNLGERVMDVFHIAQAGKTHGAAQRELTTDLQRILEGTL